MSRFLIMGKLMNDVVLLELIGYAFMNISLWVEMIITCDCSKPVS